MGDVFLEKHAEFQAARPETLDQFPDPNEGGAGIENIINHQHIPIGNVETEFLGEDQVTGRGG